MHHHLSLNGSDWLAKGFIGEDWLLRSAHAPGTRDVLGWFPASVPGTVQNDLWRAGMIPNPYVEMNTLAAEWAADRTWVYKKTFTVDPAYQGQRAALVFGGVDYAGRYYLNGEELGRSEGMFLPVRCEVGEKLIYGGENLLAVVIDPAPFEQPQIGYTSRVYTQKARMNYWWDFCPRMVHLGIWQDVALEITGPARITDVWVRQDLADDNRRADVRVVVSLDNASREPLEVEVRVYPEANPEQALRQVTVVSAGQDEAWVSFNLDHPRLWWPNGAGEQPLYVAQVAARGGGDVSDERRVTFGIRRVEFTANEAADPEARSYTLVVNGQRQYIRGWNWVPMDVMYGVEQPRKRERLLNLARRANVNLLRVWGGGLIEKEAFYEMCDRLGILIWQEFIQSSSGIDNFPSSDPAFIEFLNRTAAQAVRDRRNHPALAVWSGGNELFYAPDNLCDERHPALAALRDTVERLDPGRHWVPASPSGGNIAYQIPESALMASKLHDVHGPWEYQGVRKQYQLYNQADSLLHSEFGVEGLTNLRALNATISPARQQPVSLSNPVWHHLGAWWVKEPVWNEVFGEMPDVETLQRATQFMQADGLRYAVEADRRRQYHNSGTMPWQFNEPYPMAACTSAVDYYAEPKPVYYSVARAYRPLTVTARFDTLAWGDEIAFAAQVWCSNSGPACSAQLAAQLVGEDGSVFGELLAPVTCPADGSQPLQTLQVPLPRVTGELFFLDLELRGDSGDLLARNRYLFSKTENLAPLLHAASAQVQASLSKNGAAWEVTLSNASDHAALWAWLEADKPDLNAPQYAYFSDNYFCLLPGEQRSVRVEWAGVEAAQRRVRVSGWNFAPVELA